MRHRGWLFHVQTEDGGVKHPRIITHLFHRGVILATRRNDYTTTWSDDDVRGLMQTQHRGVLRELREGVHDVHIRAFLGDPIKPDSAPAPVAASWPAAPSPVDTSWEWRDDLHENPDLVSAWAKAALGRAPPPTKGVALKRTMALMPAVRAPRSTGERVLSQIFGERDALLRAIFPNGRLNGLVIRSNAPLVVGDHLMMQIEVGAEVCMEFQLACTVAWQGLEKRAWGVEFSSEDAAAVRQMVLLMRGERAARTRKGPLMVSGTGEASVGSLDVPVLGSVDVTERGIFIPDARDMLPGDMVPVLLGQTVDVSALSVHMLAEWRSQGTGGGAGLRFLSGDPEEEDAVARWVQSILRS